MTSFSSVLKDNIRLLTDATKTPEDFEKLFAIFQIDMNDSIRTLLSELRNNIQTGDKSASEKREKLRKILVEKIKSLNLEQIDAVISRFIGKPVSIPDVGKKYKYLLILINSDRIRCSLERNECASGTSCDLDAKVCIDDGVRSENVQVREINGKKFIGSPEVFAILDAPTQVRAKPTSTECADDLSCPPNQACVILPDSDKNECVDEKTASASKDLKVITFKGKKVYTSQDVKGRLLAMKPEERSKVASTPNKLVEYIHSLRKQITGDHCGIENEFECPDDQSCLIKNEGDVSGRCTSEPPSGAASYVYNNHKIVGSNAAVSSIQNLLKERVRQVMASRPAVSAAEAAAASVAPQVQPQVAIKPLTEEERNKSTAFLNALLTGEAIDVEGFTKKVAKNLFRMYGIEITLNVLGKQLYFDLKNGFSILRQRNFITPQQYKKILTSLLKTFQSTLSAEQKQEAQSEINSIVARTTTLERDLQQLTSVLAQTQAAESKDVDALEAELDNLNIQAPKPVVPVVVPQAAEVTAVEVEPLLPDVEESASESGAVDLQKAREALRKCFSI